MSTPSARGPTSFITSVIRATSTSTPIVVSTPSSTPYQTITSVPQAPSAAYAWGPNDGWSPTAIISIVTAIVLLLISVPLIAILLRRYERRRLRETVKSSNSSIVSSGKSSVRAAQSLRNIMVTKELQRTSLKLAEGVDKPEPAHVHERTWSRTEVKGGDWK